MNKLCYLPAQWAEHAPQNVQAVTTLRAGGVSVGGYEAFNLATHVGDEMPAVIANRKKLRIDLRLPAEPIWLEQTHSNSVIHVEEGSVFRSPPQADASVSRVKSAVCAVLTADCLPVFFCNKAGTEVAVAHAGWRGLHAGILSNTLSAMKSSPADILVSLGPAIGALAFEVGEEVYSAFMAKNSVNEAAFEASAGGHYLCDIYCLARIELQRAGVNHIAGGDACTYQENNRFYSYRRQADTGRMASLIWMT